jgi:lysozyme
MAKPISKEEAESLLNNHINNDLQSIKNLIKVDTTKNQIEALKSFVYNVGIGNFQKSTLLKKINAGDKQGAGEEFRKWIYAGGQKLNGLIKRREEERKLFLS